MRSRLWDRAPLPFSPPPCSNTIAAVTFASATGSYHSPLHLPFKLHPPTDTLFFFYWPIPAWRAISAVWAVIWFIPFCRFWAVCGCVLNLVSSVRAQLDLKYYLDERWYGTMGGGLPCYNPSVLSWDGLTPSDPLQEEGREDKAGPPATACDIFSAWVSVHVAHHRLDSGTRFKPFIWRWPRTIQLESQT